VSRCHVPPFLWKAGGERRTPIFYPGIKLLNLYKLKHKISAMRNDQSIAGKSSQEWTSSSCASNVRADAPRRWPGRAVLGWWWWLRSLCVASPKDELDKTCFELELLWTENQMSFRAFVGFVKILRGDVKFDRHQSCYGGFICAELIPLTLEQQSWKKLKRIPMEAAS
jgi:hypothetical protein